VIFVNSTIIQALSSEILRTCGRRDFAVLAYVFMPDHLHLMIEGRSPSAYLPDVMRLMRKRTTLAIQPYEKGRLWQDGYYERVLRSDEQTKAVIEYLLNNPIRAGLVNNARDYPFSWSIDYEPA
jgi:putative transposase